MKLVTIAASGIGLLAIASVAIANPDVNASQQKNKSSHHVLKTEKAKLSYTIGADLGTNFKNQSIDINPKILLKGIRDVLSGRDLLMSKQAMADTLKNFQQNLLSKRKEKIKMVAMENKQKGEAFLSDNKSKPGVETLDNGLQYKIIKSGDGIKPNATDSVTVKYTGTLINGTVFDSTDKLGKPLTFKLNQVIPAWTQALQLMKTGATWQIFVPSNLAYGERGVGGPIGPNETLIFKIHLVSVEKAKQ